MSDDKKPTVLHMVPGRIGQVVKPNEEPALFIDRLIGHWTQERDKLTSYDRAVVILAEPNGHISVSAHGKDMAAPEIAGLLTVAEHIVLNGLVTSK